MAIPYSHQPDPYTIYGMRVVITPDQPKMQLSEDCPVSPEFRQEINAWMVEFFGVTNMLADGEVMRLPNMLTMNQRTWRLAKAAALKHDPLALGAIL